MSYVATTATHTVVTTPVRGASDVPSIRRIMVRGILLGTPKAEVEAEVVKYHGASAGATKFAKHYGWYKADMKKNAPAYAKLVAEFTPAVDDGQLPIEFQA